ncbi:DUF1127 domain-containing protein [uncultured Roseibium sp.]|uniref:DUF1127 domain-containing protein n=1 Tax=uncultured Roseibium sp. TaxID=1936171 RepID=UPI0026312D98|nr:DUF1127 domain-containing protein [uncultured Roseibium sp.]
MSSMVTMRAGVLQERSTKTHFGRVLVRKLLSWSQLYRTRRQLLELTDGELDDVNLTWEAARREAERPFWDSDGHFDGESIGAQRVIRRAHT